MGRRRGAAGLGPGPDVLGGRHEGGWRFGVVRTERTDLSSRAPREQLRGLQRATKHPSLCLNSQAQRTPLHLYKPQCERPTEFHCHVSQDERSLLLGTQKSNCYGNFGRSWGQASRKPGLGMGRGPGTPSEFCSLPLLRKAQVWDTTRTSPSPAGPGRRRVKGP